MTYIKYVHIIKSLYQGPRLGGGRLGQRLRFGVERAEVVERNVPAKEGKRLQCLFYILRDEDTSSGNSNPSHQKDIGSHTGMDTLQKECAEILRKRSKMFQYVIVKCLHICVSI